MKRMDFLPNRLNKYSIRKFTVGTASILIGSLVFLGHDAKAAEEDPSNLEVQVEGETNKTDLHTELDQSADLENDQEVLSDENVENEVATLSETEELSDNEKYTPQTLSKEGKVGDVLSLDAVTLTDKDGNVVTLAEIGATLSENSVTIDANAVAGQVITEEVVVTYADGTTGTLYIVVNVTAAEEPETEEKSFEEATKEEVTVANRSAEQPAEKETKVATRAAADEAETTNASDSQFIDADAIASGKIKKGSDFQTTPGIVSGWLDVATDNYTPGINGSETPLNNYKVYLQWMDKDGTVSPVYESYTHDLGGTRAGQGGNGVYAFDIGEGWVDANGKLHKPEFQSVSKQKYKLWLAPGQTSTNGNEYFTYRKQPGNSTGFSGAVVATGEFILAGHSMQRTAIFVYEKPTNVTMTTPETEWKYDEKGPDSNPSYLPDSVNKKHKYAVSGQVWWETSTSGTTYPVSTGESFVNQTLEESATGFRVVSSVLTAEGAQALSATNNISNVNERIKQQQAILANNPQYIQQTVVAPIVGDRGRYTARFDEKIDARYMYQYVIDSEGRIVPAYTAYTSPVFTSPNSFADSTPAIMLGNTYVYNSHFALVADPSVYNIDITNYDAVNKVARPNDTAVSDVTSMYYPGETTEIVWLDSTGNELSRTTVNNKEEAEAAAQFTVPTDITERKIYTVQLVVNGNIIAADSFAADPTPKQNEEYEPGYEDGSGKPGEDVTVEAPEFKDKDGNPTTAPEGTTFTPGEN
uniref:YSIRK-type signal peptide-containing protein n=1 Tax=Nosocomiicoccus ampullae TaxID=489910 RepID=UPI0015CEFC7C